MFSIPHFNQMYADSPQDGGMDSNKIILPTTVTGSPRHLKGLALDALATVSTLGAPTMFVTF